MTTNSLSDDTSFVGAQAVTSVAYLLFILLVGVNAVVVSSLFYLSLIIPIVPAAVREVLYFADTIHAFLFLFDFGLRLKRAPHRAGYFLRWGWIDLLTAVPAFPALRLLRVARVGLMTRALQRHTPAEVRNAARKRLAQSTLLVVIAAVLLIVIYGSVAIVLVESKAAEANITTGGDAIWWAFVTIATVGYGDTYPVTPMGRLVGLLMLVAGVSVFSVLTSFLASTFLRPGANQEADRDRITHSELEEVRQTLARLEARLAAQDSRSE